MKGRLSAPFKLGTCRMDCPRGLNWGPDCSSPSGSAITTARSRGGVDCLRGDGDYGLLLDDQFGRNATYIPLTGSFAAYAGKFVSPALGFALGWNYWFKRRDYCAGGNYDRRAGDELLVPARTGLDV